MKRTQQILAAILVLQLIITGVVFWPRPVATEGSEPLFPDVAAEEIVALRITDDAGAEIELEKSGEAWVLPEADEYPTMASAITAVLENILALDTGSLVAETAASHKPLQVAEDDFMRRIIFETAAGEIQTIYLGSAPRFSATHFRLAGEDETYLTMDLTSWDLDPRVANWIDTSYVSAPQTEVEEITVENANGAFTLVRDEAGAWTLADLAEDEQISESDVSNVVNKAASMVMVRPLGKTEPAASGLDDPAASVTLKTADEEIGINIAPQAEGETNVVVKASSSDYYVHVAYANVKPLVEFAREDLLAAEEDAPAAP